MKIHINENVLQALLIALNFIFALLSISLIALGVVYTDDLSLVEFYITHISFLRLPTLLIVLGAVSFLSSLFGCYIVRKYNPTVLKIYLVFLTLLLAAELTIGCLAFHNASEPSATRTRMKMEHLLNVDHNTRSNFYILEQHFSCCGILSVDDYRSDDLVLHNGTLCHRIFYSPSMQELEGCAITVVDNLKRISFEMGGCMVVYSLLQIIDIACLIMILVKGIQPTKLVKNGKCTRRVDL